MAISALNYSFIPTQVISAKALLTHPEGLAGIYTDVLRFIPKHCGFLLGVCQGIDSGRGSAGFDFVVNSVWPEVVATIESKASVIFAPGNPDNFFKARREREMCVCVCVCVYKLVCLLHLATLPVLGSSIITQACGSSLSSRATAHQWWQ